MKSCESQAPVTQPEKCSPAGSFDVSSSTADEQIAESFIRQAMEIIVDEAVKKATNVQEKVTHCCIYLLFEIQGI